MLAASHWKRCTLDTHQAASGIPPTASHAARRIWPLLPAPPRSSRLAFQVRPPASDETPDSPQASCGEPTRQHGCNRMPQAACAHRIWRRKLAAAQNGAPLRVQPRNELRRTARCRLHMEPSERVKQKLLGACASRSDAAAPRYQIQGTRAPECKGQQPPRPVLACAASILLAQKAGLAPAEAEMHKKASFREPARQSGRVLMLPIAAGRRVGCRKRHSLESARPLSPSCSISVG